ncbi:MAG: TraR/DksA C4-type zinc finger protein [Thermodesulfobacterium sp.]|nr:TraR/DksA C4-type zinc finger protein [Thermodesulfobacterium sp.]
MEVKKEFLKLLFDFHGHKCWASALGLRAGLIALRELKTQRTGTRSLYCLIEVGHAHGAVCFADGVQVATGCSIGKGNLIKTLKGKLAFTLIDIKNWKKIRIAYNGKLKDKIANTAFMKKRAAGIPPTEIPDEEAMEAINIVLEAPEDEIFFISPVKDTNFEPPEEVLGSIVCDICGEWVSIPYVRILGEKKVCIDCAGYTEGFER